MKTISYSKMREELADVLDMLRNGEDITITQRGRPDITISARSMPAIPSGSSWKMVSQSSKNETRAQEFKGSRKEAYVQFRESTASKNARISFGEAKAKTQTKHAKIIKALEDK